MENEKENILDHLSHERVLDISKNEDGTFEFREGCDDYFSVNLSKEDVKKLITELEELIK